MEKILINKEELLDMTKSGSFLDDYEIMYDIVNDHIWFLPHQRFWEYVFILKGEDFRERPKEIPEWIVDKIYDIIYKVERMNTC